MIYSPSVNGVQAVRKADFYSTKLQAQIAAMLAEGQDFSSILAQVHAASQEASAEAGQAGQEVASSPDAEALAALVDARLNATPEGQAEGQEGQDPAKTLSPLAIPASEVPSKGKGKGKQGRKGSPV
jgi:hypothetical protein